MVNLVLVTRPEPGASETAARLVARGFQPVLAPCLSVTPRAARLPTRVAAVLTTSGQAVDALPATLHDTLLLAVGDATARRAKAAGFSQVRSADGDASDLLRMVRRLCDPAAGPLLLAVGARQGTSFAADLRAAGFSVMRRVVYAARAANMLPTEVAQSLAKRQVYAALFFSTETAHAFVGMIPARLRESFENVDALAIGPRAAAALRVLPWRDVRVALRPTQDELLALL